jgi:hypothetical protein
MQSNTVAGHGCNKSKDRCIRDCRPITTFRVLDQGAGGVSQAIHQRRAETSPPDENYVASGDRIRTRQDYYSIIDLNYRLHRLGAHMKKSQTGNAGKDCGRNQNHA